MGLKMAIRKILFVVRAEDRRQTWWEDSVPGTRGIARSVRELQVFSYG